MDAARSCRSRIGVAVGCLLLTALGGCAPADGEIVPLDVYRDRLEAVRNHDFPQTIRILDRHGALLSEIVDQGYRTWVPLEDIAVAVRQAAIATEDRTFYENTGVDKRAVARAAVQNARAGGTVSGASTITMQLVRLVAFPPEERIEQSLERKVREVHLAAEMDEQLSKDEILEAYLNVAFFGRQAYGIEAAAERFFGLQAADLGIAEASFLVGLLQAPGALSPDGNPEGARARQRVVLDSMVAIGAIAPRAADMAFERPLVFVPPPPPPQRGGSHFVDAVLQELPRRLGREVAARGGYEVRTTLDPELEERTRKIAAGHVASLRAAHNIGDAAVVVLRPDTGEVLAMVGGTDYDEPREGQVNAAVFPRQPGSAFKPIVYAAALESGWTAASLLWDAPVDFPNGNGTSYRATNYDDKFRGPVRLRNGLANSLNAAAVALAAEVGIDTVHELADNMGLSLGEDPWRFGLSLALGGAEVSLLELTSGLGSFGNGGRHVRPTTIGSIERIHDGQPIYVGKRASRRVVSPQTAWLISDMLDDDAARTPAFGANNPLDASQPIAVKTGTTNDFRDNLTVGWTPWLAVGVWTGNKDGRPMRNVLGITGAAPIWRDTVEAIFGDERLMRLLGDGQPPQAGFPVPTGITRADVCDLSTILASGSCRERREAFAQNGPSTDLELTYGFFVDGGSCATRVGSSSQGRLALLAPAHPRVSAAVRGWWRGRPPVAAPPCSGAAEAHSPARGDGGRAEAAARSGG